MSSRRSRRGRKFLMARTTRLESIAVAKGRKPGFSHSGVTFGPRQIMAYPQAQQIPKSLAHIDYAAIEKRVTADLAKESDQTLDDIKAFMEETEAQSKWHWAGPDPDDRFITGVAADGTVHKTQKHA